MYFLRRKARSFCLTAIALLAMTGLVFGEDAPTLPEKPATKEAPGAKHASGEVTFIDAAEGKMTVKTGKEELHLHVQEGAARKSMLVIKVGDKVNVSYRRQGDLLIVDTVNKVIPSTELGGSFAAKSG